MSTTPTPEPTSTSSYTMLESSDVDAIGAHCNYTYCHQLDFLPFRCQSCQKTYCLDHRTETSHACPKAGEWARARRDANTSTSTTSIAGLSTQKPSLLTNQQCSSPVCKTFVNTSQNLGVQCDRCNRTYCLKHRFQEEHDCKNLKPLGARTGDASLAANKEKIRIGFRKLTGWTRETAEKTIPKPKPTSKAAQIVALNKLKQSATGDDKVPSDKRVYLHCSATDKVTKDGKPKEAGLWFHQDWKVGRILDLISAKLGVENVNNQIDDNEKKLRVFHIESGEVLDFGERTGQRMVSGNSVVLVRGLDV